MPLRVHRAMHHLHRTRAQTLFIFLIFIAAAAAAAAAAVVVGAAAAACGNDPDVTYYTEEQRRHTRTFLNALSGAIPALAPTWVCRDFCAWPYIRCSPTGVQVLLGFASVAGSLPDLPPATVMNPSQVVVSKVDVSNNNDFGGTLPASWGSLTSLVYVSVSGTVSYDTGVSGTLPESWGGLVNLATFAAACTQLTGTLPESWGRMTKLTTLMLFNNGIDGTLPASWGGLASLQLLYLTRNKLSGPLPSSWGSLANLRHVFLAKNALRGSVPESWGGLKSVEYLQLAANKLSGTVPESLGELRAVKQVYLLGNRLSDALPTVWTEPGSAVNVVTGPDGSGEEGGDSSSAVSSASHSSGEGSSHPSTSSNPTSSSSSSTSSSGGGSHASAPLVSSSSFVSSGGEGSGGRVEGSSGDGGCADMDWLSADQQRHTVTFLVAVGEALSLLHTRWMSGCVCEWAYVACTATGVSLNVSGAGASGTLPDMPPSVEAAHVLVDGIDISRCPGIHGTLPDGWGDLEALRSLSVAHTSVSGTIPSSWGRLGALTHADFSGAGVTGCAPDAWVCSATLNVSAMGLAAVAACLCSARCPIRSTAPAPPSPALPWWGVLLIVLGVAGVAGGGAVFVVLRVRRARQAKRQLRVSVGENTSSGSARSAAAQPRGEACAAPPSTPASASPAAAAAAAAASSAATQVHPHSGRPRGGAGSAGTPSSARVTLVDDWHDADDISSHSDTSFSPRSAMSLDVDRGGEATLARATPPPASWRASASPPPSDQVTAAALPCHYAADPDDGTRRQRSDDAVEAILATLRSCTLGVAAGPDSPLHLHHKERGFKSESLGKGILENAASTAVATTQPQPLRAAARADPMRTVDADESLPAPRSPPA